MSCSRKTMRRQVGSWLIRTRPPLETNSAPSLRTSSPRRRVLSTLHPGWNGWALTSSLAAMARCEHRDNQDPGPTIVVTASDTSRCHDALDDETASTAAARIEATAAMGRIATRLRPQAGTDSPRSPSTSPYPRGTPPVCDPKGAEGRPLSPLGASRAAARAQLPRGARTRPLPAGPLLDPGQPPPHDRRGDEQLGSGKRHEVHRRASRPRSQPRLRAQRSCSRRPLPRAHPAHAARGEERAGLRAAQRAAPPLQGRTPGPSNRAHGSRLFGPLVRRLARSAPPGARPAGGRQGAHMAASNRVAEGGSARRIRGTGQAVATVTDGSPRGGSRADLFILPTLFQLDGTGLELVVPPRGSRRKRARRGRTPPRALLLASACQSAAAALQRGRSSRHRNLARNPTSGSESGEPDRDGLADSRTLRSIRSISTRLDPR